jgi:hypothetical protein
MHVDTRSVRQDGGKRRWPRVAVRYRTNRPIRDREMIHRQRLAEDLLERANRALDEASIEREESTISLSEECERTAELMRKVICASRAYRAIRASPAYRAEAIHATDRCRPVRRQRSTRRGRVVARIAAKLAASTGGTSGDDPPEPPTRRRRPSQGVAS